MSSIFDDDESETPGDILLKSKWGLRRQVRDNFPDQQATVPIIPLQSDPQPSVQRRRPRPKKAPADVIHDTPDDQHSSAQRKRPRPKNRAAVVIAEASPEQRRLCLAVLVLISKKISFEKCVIKGRNGHEAYYLCTGGSFCILKNGTHRTSKPFFEIHRNYVVTYCFAHQSSGSTTPQSRGARQMQHPDQKYIPLLFSRKNCKRCFLPLSRDDTECCDSCIRDHPCPPPLMEPTM